MTGICFPIALSFVLVGLMGATPLQAFAAGAALCSTSLGTTFTVLSTSGLTTTRLGTVLSTAAMLDDVVGLVMVQIISNLGRSSKGSEGFDYVTVVRPLGVSLGFAVVTPLVCRFLILPERRWLEGMRKRSPNGMLQKVCGGGYTPFLVQTSVLLGFVASSSYAGTSNLFAAYLAGAVVSWWDSEHLTDSKIEEDSIEAVQERVRYEVPVDDCPNSGVVSKSEDQSPQSMARDTKPQKDTRKTTSASAGSGILVYNHYYTQPVERILKPFFFVRILLPFLQIRNPSTYPRKGIYRLRNPN